MRIYLIRHAHAGSRSAWKGDDRQRPLSKRGQRQAEALRKHLSGRPIGRVLSSPAVRCVQTVAPLADDRDLAVETSDVFAEGAHLGRALEAMTTSGAEEVAVSCHGDLIPAVIRRAVATGMRTRDPVVSQKGSMWVLDLEEGRLVAGRYYPPG